MSFFRLAGIFFLLLVFFLTGSNCYSASPRQLINDIFLCQIQQHALLTQYHIFSSDPKFINSSNDLKKELAAASARIDAVDADLRELKLATKADEIKQQYSALDAFIGQNYGAVVKKGWADSAVVSDMVQEEMALVESLGKVLNDIQFEQKVVRNQRLDQARYLALLMQYTVARYIERSVSAGGDVTRYDSKEATIDELAMDFQAGLDKLQSSPANSEDIKKELAIIATKWRFIRGSLISYDQKTVPFTIDRHGKDIVFRLKKLAGDFNISDSHASR